MTNDFFTTYDRFLKTSTVGNWPDRLNARHDAIVSGNLEAFKDARVLDIASHDGRWTFAALRAGAAHVTGIEVRADLVAAATLNLEHFGVSEDRFRFVHADAFERRDIFEGPYDVVLCLGFLYHTTRHVELIQLIRRTQARTVIFDTLLANVSGNLSTLFVETCDDPANGLDDMGVRNGRIMVAHPSPGCLELMLKHFGYSMKRCDWKPIFARRGLTPDKDSKVSAANPVADYFRDDRGTFVARL